MNFNPRTREGCDTNQSGFDYLDKLFQSTHPRGVRLKKTSLSEILRQISIHAPARGATGYAFIAGLIAFYFNPRTREGCDMFFTINLHWIFKFQSTHPRGVRRLFAIDWRAIVKFQSTHPRGVRHTIELFILVSEVISIHAPARGATIYERETALP